MASPRTKTTVNKAVPYTRQPGLVGTVGNSLRGTIQSTGATVEETFNGVHQGVKGLGYQAKTFRVESALDYAQVRAGARDHLSTLKYSEEEIANLLGDL